LYGPRSPPGRPRQSLINYFGKIAHRPHDPQWLIAVTWLIWTFWPLTFNVGGFELRLTPLTTPWTCVETVIAWPLAPVALKRVNAVGPGLAVIALAVPGEALRSGV
jgi:hypothetical protein